MSGRLQRGLPGAIVAVFLATTIACAGDTYPVSDHYDGRIFFNPGEKWDKSFWTFLRWQLTRDRAEWPESLPAAPKPRLHPVEPGEVHVTWIGHATCLVRFNGWTVLTDPMFSNRASPVSWAGPVRVRPPALAAGELPPVDVVVISHNHYEHLDIPSLVTLDQLHSPLFVVPLANAVLLREAGIRNVVELDWWDSRTLSGESKVTLVPARHWSARGLFDRFEMLWGGYVVEHDGIAVFFAGDTGYGRHFRKVREKLGPMQVSLIPIGAYEPRWFMEENHTNPNDAVLAHLDLESNISMGIHFGTFQLSDEAVDEPPKALSLAREKHGVPVAAFIAPETGQTIRWKRYGN